MWGGLQWPIHHPNLYPDPGQAFLHSSLSSCPPPPNLKYARYSECLCHPRLTPSSEGSTPSSECLCHPRLTPSSEGSTSSSKCLCHPRLTPRSEGSTSSSECLFHPRLTPRSEGSTSSFLQNSSELTFVIRIHEFKQG